VLDSYEIAENDIQSNFYKSIKEINYCIEIVYDVSTQPPIHGIVMEMNVEVYMKDGGIIEVKCDWEDGITITDRNSLTDVEVETIEEILIEKIPEELQIFLRSFPTKIEGTIKCD
jgi:hypothetical protein